MPDPQVLIVGAGPTGLVLALRLARHGVPFRIIAKAPGPGEASRAMIIHARTLEFYDQLGIAEEVIAAGIKTETVHLREGGEDRARFALADMGEGLSPLPMMLCLPQDDHERLLVAKLAEAGVTVDWDTELTGLTQTPNHVEATLVHDGATETMTVPYVAGCDGARSMVRHALQLDFPGGTYDQLFYVADVRVEGGFAADAYMNVGPDAFALLLPVRSSGMQRLLGACPAGARDREALVFDDVRAEAEALAGVHVAEVNGFSTYRVSHRVAAAFQRGRCFLAGDAGHIHSPAGGQGMNTGIGDAVNLSWKLASVLRGDASPAVLDTYDPERIAFARTLIRTTDRAFRILVASGVRGALLRKLVLPNVMRGVTSFAAGRRALFRTVSQIRVNYPGSALSAGHAGRVTGGDRLPYVPGPDGGNFAPLRSMAWQVHVYGTPAAAVVQASTALNLPLRVMPWSPAARRAGLGQDDAYLVRPDGYVGLALHGRDAGPLHAYAERLGLRFTPSAG